MKKTEPTLSETRKAGNATQESEGDEEACNAKGYPKVAQKQPRQEYRACNAKGYPEVAQKQPRQFRSIDCDNCRHLKRKVAKLRKRVKLLERSKGYIEDDYAIPRPGLLPKKIGEKYKMVELVPGSSIYIHRPDLVSCFKPGKMKKGSVKYGLRMARWLMSVFFSSEEIANGTLNSSTEGKKQLNPRTIKAIIDICSKNSPATPGQLRQAIACKITSFSCKSRKNKKSPGKTTED
ncbi:uncharacterized protein LOC106179974 isoform X2 [Lingula anatina]|nr:uncharacterized protein LOC106179974 isoform X2 [Lingula anatina]|eukprot:XP_013419257.1 uncharacterized protein LOC106179974 isoform X2 [Lingula anatina]